MAAAAPSLGAQRAPPFSSAHGSRFQTKGVRKIHRLLLNATWTASQASGTDGQVKKRLNSLKKRLFRKNKPSERSVTIWDYTQMAAFALETSHTC